MIHILLAAGLTVGVVFVYWCYDLFCRFEDDPTMHPEHSHGPLHADVTAPSATLSERERPFLRHSRSGSRFRSKADSPLLGEQPEDLRRAA
ncbi:protein of unknown function [Candidatus Nitrospira inopinata]|uniref:Uncharacterized protein n=1 Tax=Candidatus Nitrospira inopinata TaxID=1715989 RepID=A0A0S4KTA9_9BACT|nr:protein of unknown function [Candidatus Nitrospira inopinata]